MQAVGRAGGAVVIEVRRQFKNLRIMKGKRKPDGGRLADLLTKAAIKEMIIHTLPGFINCLYFVILQIGGLVAAYLLGAMLLGVIITDFCCLNDSGGGAWENAKTYRRWKFGGKGSEAHN